MPPGATSTFTTPPGAVRFSAAITSAAASAITSFEAGCLGAASTRVDLPSPRRVSALGIRIVTPLRSFFGSGITFLLYFASATDSEPSLYSFLQMENSVSPSAIGCMRTPGSDSCVFVAAGFTGAAGSITRVWRTGSGCEEMGVTPCVGCTFDTFVAIGSGCTVVALAAGGVTAAMVMGRAARSRPVSDALSLVVS